jgi:hypothetical protein
MTPGIVRPLQGAGMLLGGVIPGFHPGLSPFAPLGHGPCLPSNRGSAPSRPVLVLVLSPKGGTRTRSPPNSEPSNANPSFRVRVRTRTNANGVASTSPGSAEERGLPWVQYTTLPNRNAVVALPRAPPPPQEDSPLCASAGNALSPWPRNFPCRIPPLTGRFPQKRRTTQDHTHAGHSGHRRTAPPRPRRPPR